jgi:tripartite-type tricarboxylate transporter receptor subunit TctC
MKLPMNMPAWLRAAMALACTLGAATPAWAADAFPSRPVHIVVATAPGGWGDTTMRLVAIKMSEKLGQPIVIDNRPGADSLVGIRHVKSSAPDGYTLLSTGATIMLQPVVKKDPGYELLKDFTGVGSTARSPAVLVVPTSSPASSLSEFVKLAKDDPSRMSFGSAGVGSATHIPAEMFMQKAGVKMLHVPYKGNGAGMADLMSGRVSMMFDAYSSSVGSLKGGRLKALGVTSDTRLRALPEVPTFAEQGFPGLSYYYWLGLFAPAGTPPEVVQRLSAALRDALADPALSHRLQSEGTEPMVMSPAEFNAYLRTESARIGKFATELGWTKD